MESKQAYLEQTATAQADTTLTQLYATRSQLLSRIQGWRSAYTAPMDGRVSYSFDGFEAYLTTEVLDLLSAQNVRELLRNEDPEQPAGAAQPAKPLPHRRCGPLVRDHPDHGHQLDHRRWRNLRPVF